MSSEQVLAAWHTESQAWEFEHDSFLLSGHTWGNGPPLYFLRGTVGTAAELALLTYLLREDFRCVVLNERRSTPGGSRVSEMTPAGAATDLFAVADALGDADGLTLYSMGSGCLTAWEAALSQPNRVQRLIVQGGFTRHSLSWAERFLVQVGRLCPGRLRHLPGFVTLLTANHRAWFPPFDADRWDRYADDAGETSTRDFARRARTLLRCDFRERLRQLHTPTLLIRGEGDGRSLAARQDEVIGLLPSCHVETMPSAGRLPHITHPHRVAKLVRNFCADEA